MKPDNTLGNRVRRLRRMLDLTQFELEARIGATQGRVSRIERGCTNPSARVVSALAQALGTTTDYLLRGE